MLWDPIGCSLLFLLSLAAAYVARLAYKEERQTEAFDSHHHQTHSQGITTFQHSQGYDSIKPVTSSPNLQSTSSSASPPSPPSPGIVVRKYFMLMLRFANLSRCISVLLEIILQFSCTHSDFINNHFSSPPTILRRLLSLSRIFPILTFGVMYSLYAAFLMQLYNIVVGIYGFQIRNFFLLVNLIVVAASFILVLVADVTRWAYVLVFITYLIILLGVLWYSHHLFHFITAASPTAYPTVQLLSRFKPLMYVTGSAIIANVLYYFCIALQIFPISFTFPQLSPSIFDFFVFLITEVGPSLAILYLIPSKRPLAVSISHSQIPPPALAAATTLSSTLGSATATGPSSSSSLKRDSISTYHPEGSVNTSSSLEMGYGGDASLEGKPSSLSLPIFSFQQSGNLVGGKRYQRLQDQQPPSLPSQQSLPPLHPSSSTQSPTPSPLQLPIGGGSSKSKR